MRASHRSPDGAKRNPGMNEMLAPDFAALHPGYGFNFQTSDTHSRSRGLIRPSFALNFLTLLIRGRRERRMPVAPAASCALGIGRTHTSNNEYTGITRHSPRNGFTVSFVLSPAIGLFCHRHRRNCFHRLDTSVEMSGPHDFTVRIGIARLARRRVHRGPSLRP